MKVFKEKGKIIYVKTVSDKGWDKTVTLKRYLK